MGDVNAAAETIRQALDGGVPLLYLEDRQNRRAAAEAALDALVAEVERQKEGLEDWSAEYGRWCDERRKLWAEVEQLRQQLRESQDATLSYRMRVGTAANAESLTDQIEQLRAERDAARESDEACHYLLKEALRLQREALDREQRLQEALDAADWLISCLRVLREGGVVRGMDEANAGYASARAALTATDPPAE